MLDSERTLRDRRMDYAHDLLAIDCALYNQLIDQGPNNKAPVLSGLRFGPLRWP